MLGRIRAPLQGRRIKIETANETGVVGLVALRPIKTASSGRHHQSETRLHPARRAALRGASARSASRSTFDASALLFAFAFAAKDSYSAGHPSREPCRACRDMRT